MGNITRVKNLYKLTSKKINKSLLTDEDIAVLEVCRNMIRNKDIDESFSPIDVIKISHSKDADIFTNSINALIRFNYITPSGVAKNFTPTPDLSYRGVTYFVRDFITNNIKIGITCDLNKRFNQLKVANPHIELLGFIKGNYESKLHGYFSKYKISGEWFSISLSQIKEYLGGNI